MSTGDIVDITIRPDGWSADVTFEGMAAGGAYDFGFDLANKNKVDTARMILSLTSVGYDSTGIANTKTRTIYGTKQVRLPYPNNADMDETVVGSNLVVRVALSEYVYTDCSIITAACAAGIYHDGTNASTLSNLSVTNNSTAEHQRVIANWSIPGWREVDDDGSLMLKCVAFHRSATNRNLGISCVKFSVTDGTNTVNKTVTTATIDTAENETYKTIEYIANFTAGDLVSMIHGSQLECDFVAYPYIGDSNSILDTSDGVNNGLTPLYTTQYNYLPNITGDDRYYAYVKTGSTGGTASTVASTAQSDPFATIAAAANAIAVARGSNAERGIVRLSNLAGQSHAWAGGTVSVGTMSKTYITVETWDEAGDSSKAVITNQSGSKHLGARYKITNCEVNANATGFFDSGDVIWFDSNTLIDSCVAPNYKNDICYFTNNDITGSEWMTSYATVKMQVALSRGNVGSSGNSSHVSLGNDLTASETIYYKINEWNAGFDGSIIAFNKIKSDHRLSICGTGNDYSHGIALIQNVLEILPYAETEPALQISADGAVNNVNNLLHWNNTVVGQRYNGCYLDNGTVDYEKKYWSIKCDVFEDYNFKTDTFADDPDGNRVGNWPEGYGCGYSGNIDGNSSTRGAAQFYNSDPDNMRGFDGIDYALHSDLVPVLFVDYQAGYGGVGSGDYHLSPDALNKLLNDIKRL